MLIVAAQVGITPSEFWGDPGDISTGFSLREFDLFVRGYEKRIEASHHLLAWHAACVMNCWTKRKVTPQQLLGKEKNKLSPEELKRELSEENARLAKDVVAEVGEEDRSSVYSDEEEEDDWIDDMQSSMS